MESLELKIFREVALTNSISKAAQQMGYVQSNVTAHIKKLENELNTTLFLRHNQGVTLTSAGEKLLSYADKILNLLEQATYELKKHAALRVGATQTLSISRLPFWLSIFQNQFPHTSISLITDTQTHLMHCLSEQTIDCAFAEEKYISKQMKSIYSFSEPLAVIAPPNKTESQIIQMPIVINKIKTCPYRQKLIKWLSLKNVHSSPIVELDTVEAILRAVSFGMGISLLPVNILFDKQPNFTVLQTTAIENTIIHLIINRHNNNETVKQFQEIIKNPRNTCN